MIVPVAPPVPVPIYSGFDYVTVDAPRRRVIAAHSGSRAVLLVDADTGKVTGNIRLGDATHGVAFDPLSGHVFAGTGGGDIVEIDPETKKVLHTVSVPGPVDAIAYDASTGRLYADEDDGTRMWVVDVRTFKLVATVMLPGHKPEYLAIDPQTHDIYQNIADAAELAVIDTKSDKVRATYKTPELVSNHPLQYDPAYGQIVIAGSNGVMSVYDRSGMKQAQLDVPKGIDQCDLDPGTHILGCAHGGNVTLIQLVKNGTPKVLETTTVAPGIHTIAIDPKTHDIWVVWGNPDGSGDFVQHLTSHPAGAGPATPRP